MPEVSAFTDTYRERVRDVLMLFHWRTKYASSTSAGLSVISLAVARNTGWGSDFGRYLLEGTRKRALTPERRNVFGSAGGLAAGVSEADLAAKKTGGKTAGVTGPLTKMQKLQGRTLTGPAHGFHLPLSESCPRPYWRSLRTACGAALACAMAATEACCNT